MSEHASVTIDGWKIPLIGLPVDATLCECDLCHDFFNLQQLEVAENGAQLLCEKCRTGSNASGPG